jgi:hypothetical protein
MWEQLTLPLDFDIINTNQQDWGEDSMYKDLALALRHAAPRKGDDGYYIRMAVSFLLSEAVMEETGYGLYACKINEIGYMDHPIVIDLRTSTVHDFTGIHEIEKFIEYHVGAMV